MDSHFHSHVLIQITILFFLFLHSLSPATANLVSDVCKETKNPPSCVSALNQDPKSPSTTDVKALAKIALQLAVSNSTTSKNDIQNLAKKSTQPTLKKALDICVSSYVQVVASFNSSLHEIDEDPQTANYDASVAGDGARSCEDALASGGLKVASVSTLNGYVFLHSNIGDVITSRLY